MEDQAEGEFTDQPPPTNYHHQLREAITNKDLAINLLMNNEQEDAETFILLCHQYERQSSDVQGNISDTRKAESHVQPISKEHPNQEKQFKDLKTGSVALDVAFEKCSMCADEVKETSFQDTFLEGKVFEDSGKQDTVQDEQDPIHDSVQDIQPYPHLEDDQSFKDPSDPVQTTEGTHTNEEAIKQIYRVSNPDNQTTPNSEAPEVDKLVVQNDPSFDVEGQVVEGSDEDVLAMAQSTNIDKTEEPIGEEPGPHGQVLHDPCNGDDHGVERVGFEEVQYDSAALSTLDNFEVVNQYDSTTEGHAERDGRHGMLHTLDDLEVADKYDSATEKHAERDGRHMMPQTLGDFKVEQASVDPSHTDSEEYHSGLDHGERASRNPTFETGIPGWPNPVMEHMFRNLRHFEVPVFAFAGIEARNGAEHAPEYFVSEARSAEATFDDRDAFGDSHAERQGSEDPDAKIHRICNVNSVQNSDPIERQTLQGIDREKQASGGLSTDQDIGCCDPSASYREQDPDLNNTQLEYHNPMPFPPPLLNIYQYEPDDIPYSIEVQDDDDDEFINLHPHHDNNPN